MPAMKKCSLTGKQRQDVNENGNLDYSHTRWNIRGQNGEDMTTPAESSFSVASTRLQQSNWPTKGLFFECFRRLPGQRFVQGVEEIAHFSTVRT